MKKEIQIRLIAAADIEEVLDIYAPFVQNTAITFEYEVPSIAEFRDRVLTITSEYPWLICVVDDKIAGFAYASRFRYRTAYQWSVESAIYISPQTQSKGIGKALYTTLFDLLRLQGYVNVYAGTCIPNDKSVALHRKMGFKEIGTFSKIGFKHGKWHDTLWFQLNLCAHNSNPEVPTPMSNLKENAGVSSILEKINQSLNIAGKNG